MPNLKEQFVRMLSRKKVASPGELMSALGLPKGEFEELVASEERSGTISVLRKKRTVADATEEGEKDVREGFPEQKLILSINAKGSIKLADADAISLGASKRNGWVKISGGAIQLTDAGMKSLDSEYTPRALLKSLLASGDQKRNAEITESNLELLKVLEKRGLVRLRQHSEIASIALSGNLGAAQQAASGDPGISRLTRAALKENAWVGRKFKPYDVNADVEQINPARLHPVHKLLNRIRSIWIGMGFTEVDGPIIESAFWNFDALFSPQDHPTREMQDTFFLSNPNELDIEDIELLSRVKKMHVNGWREAWREEIAKKSLLRTHTTVVSARHIYKYGRKSPGSYPIKLFSIGKVFRNETIDYKHLAELFQFDGIIMGEGLTLSNLMHTLRNFYSNAGIDAEFRPSYFPFVEPGLEAYYYDDKLKDEIELCGGGIIRTEITKALGTKKRVLAWGGGLDRMLFNAIELDALSDLYRNNIGWLRNVKEIKPL